MSLWTPDGERPIRRDPSPTDPAPTRTSAPSTPTPAGGPSLSIQEELERLSPEQRAEAEAMLAEMARVQEELAGSPAADVVANHLMGFYELAAIHLSQQPPNFGEASVAIDAMQLVLEGLGERLGENVAPLAQALQQIQMAFVEVRRRAGEPET